MININKNQSIYELQNKTLQIVKSCSNSCRLCMQKDEQKFVSIFQQIGPNLPNYSILAMSFAKLEISANDKYPKIICIKCAEKLHQFHEFRKKCEFSQLKLITVLSLGEAIKNETFHNDDDDDGFICSPPRAQSPICCANVDDSDKDIKMDKKDVKPVTQQKPQQQQLIKLKRITIPSICSDTSNIQFKRIVKNSVTESSDGTKKLSETIILRGIDTDNDTNLAERMQKKREIRLAYDREKRFQCEECGNTFARKSDLAQHSYRHTGLKPYCCDICTSYFTRKSHLVSHMLIHNSIKPYTCDICGNSFRKLSNMARHKEHTHTHSSVFRYSCEICGRSFKRLSGVKHHLRVHTGARPYKCQDCPNAYKSHSGLRKHLRRLHPNSIPKPKIIKTIAPA